MAIPGLQGCGMQKFEVAPLNTATVNLHAAITLPATYAKTASDDVFLATSLATDHHLKMAAGGDVAVGDILKDAAKAELVIVTDIALAPTYTVTRGYRNTTRVSHSAAATWNKVGITVPLVLLATELAACPQLLNVKGATTGTLTGNVTIYGKNIMGQTISEVVALSNSNAVPTTKAFKVATSVDVPCLVTAGDTVSLGVTKAMGLPAKVPALERMFIHNFDGTTDAGSVTYDAADVSKCLYTPAGTPNGVKKVTLYYVTV